MKSLFLCLSVLTLLGETTFAQSLSRDLEKSKIEQSENEKKRNADLENFQQQKSIIESLKSGNSGASVYVRVRDNRHGDIALVLLKRLSGLPAELTKAGARSSTQNGVAPNWHSESLKMKILVHGIGAADCIQYEYCNEEYVRNNPVELTVYENEEHSILNIYVDESNKDRVVALALAKIAEAMPKFVSMINKNSDKNTLSKIFSQKLGMSVACGDANLNDCQVFFQKLEQANLNKSKLSGFILLPVYRKNDLFTVSEYRPVIEIGINATVQQIQQYFNN